MCNDEFRWTVHLFALNVKKKKLNALHLASLRIQTQLLIAFLKLINRKIIHFNALKSISFGIDNNTYNK